MSSPNFSIAGRWIGPGAPCFVIAEAGVNHHGDLERAMRLIDVAAAAGADAVKFQTFRADYQGHQTGAADSQFDRLRRLELSEESHRRLQAHAAARGVLFMSTPFDEESADLLDHLDVAVFKLPSGEITNLPLLQHVARKGKPMIVSTGMASLGEVELAVQTIEETGNDQFVLLHCVSQYPADPADVNLRAMQTLAIAFAKAVGYSDHTLGNEVSLAAVALGACVIEKHYTLDRGPSGPDHAASSEPGELTCLIKGIRKIESALGQGRKQLAASEASTAAVARKSLVAAQDIPAGAILTMNLIAIKRPGTGLSPALRHALVGRTARKYIPADTVLTMDMVA